MVGALTAARGAPVDTFSIGFDAEGFDEMEYARCTAERCGSRPHEYYLKPADIVTAIPIIARDTTTFRRRLRHSHLLFAKVAREARLEHMIAGDGGDEIFVATHAMPNSACSRPTAVYRAAASRTIKPISHLPGLSTHFPLSKLKITSGQARTSVCH